MNDDHSARKIHGDLNYPAKKFREDFMAFPNGFHGNFVRISWHVVRISDGMSQVFVRISIPSRFFSVGFKKPAPNCAPRPGIAGWAEVGFWGRRIIPFR